MLEALSSYAFGQSDIRFQRLAREEGLPDLNISAICQDSQGFIWLGTGNGICRYDGYDFLSFLPIETGISGGAVSQIIEDHTGNLWVASMGGGVSRVNLSTFAVTTWQRRDSSGLENDYCNNIRLHDNGLILVSTDDGLFFHSPNQTSPFWEKIQLPEAIPSTIIDAVLDPWSCYWIATSRKGLYRWDPASNKIDRFNAAENSIFQSNLLKSLALTKAHGEYQLWVAAYMGFFCLHLTPEGYSRLESPLDSIAENIQVPRRPRLMGFEVQSSESIWLHGYREGLIAVKSVEDKWKVTQYRNDPLSSHTLPGNEIYASCLDRQGVLWVGVEGHGLCKSAIRQTEQLKEFFHHKYVRKTGSQNIQSITAFYEDNSGNLYIGLEGGGMHVYNADDSLLQIWMQRSNARFRLPNVIVTNILPENDSILWVGTFGGLARINTRSGASKFYLHDSKSPNSLSDNHIFSLCRTKEGLWVGTRGGGLNLLDLNSNSWRHFRHDENTITGIPDDYIWKIVNQGDSVLWMCTDGGLTKMDIESEKFRTWTHDPADPNSLGHRFINSVLIDRLDQIWIATAGGGLSMLSSSHDRIQSFRVSDGFPSNYLYDIIEDQQGLIWVSSDAGLFTFSPAEAGSGEFPSLKIFTENDGLQGDEFNSGALYVTDSGTILAGGLNGYNQFRPEGIPQYAATSLPTLTSIKVGNEIVLPDSCQDRPCWEIIDGAPILSLSDKDYFTHISFSSLDFIDPSSIQYAYRLAGIDPTWNYIGNHQSISLAKLPSGEHKLWLRSSSGRQVWNEGRPILTILVAPPWWQTWWAICLWVLLIAIIISGWVRFRLQQQARRIETENRISQARQEAREGLRKQAARDFHDELGNRITRVSLFGELLSRQGNLGEESRHFLEKINLNIQALSHGMRDLIWVLDPGRDNLEDTCDRLHAFGEELFEYSGIRFTCHIQGLETENTLLPSRTRKNILLIFQEAMNNALKYSQATHIILEIVVEKDLLSIQLTDDGLGFEPNSRTGGDGFRNMQERASAESASLAIKSEPGHGVVVTFQLPMTIS